MPVTTATPDTESGFRELGVQVKAAEEAMIELLSLNESRVWTIRELQDETAQVGNWRSSVVSIAYRRLARRGDVLQVGADLRVRAL